MDFIDEIQLLASRLPKQLEYCGTEEATKNALILPFIQALGYDIFNPAEVVPEFTADIGTKKGEKVDYAVLIDGQPVILLECKWSGADLSEANASQLYRYFSVVHKVRFGVLTNGVEYRFYSDLDSPNRMDEKPFFVFNMLDFQDRDVAELKKFTKSAFDLEQILTTASELKYTAAMVRILADEFEQPSDEFVRFLATQVYSGRMTAGVREQFSEIVRRALRRFLNDRISERLKSALGNEERPKPGEIAVDVSSTEPESVLDESVVRVDEERGIVTTEDEIEAYFVVKSILREVCDTHRVHMRDAKTYCSVLFDDNNRRPIVRLRFNATQKFIGLIDETKKEERVRIETVDDIYSYSDRIVATAKWYCKDES